MARFFDTFFIVTALLVAALTAADWLIGKEGRFHIRQRVGDFWTAIQYHSVDELFLRFCYRISLAISRLFGPRPLSLRFFVVSSVLNLVLLIAVVALIASLTGDDFFAMGVMEMGLSDIRDIASNPITWIFIVMPIFAGWISFASLAWALDVSPDRGATWGLVATAFLRLAAGTAMFALAVWVIAWLFVVVMATPPEDGALAAISAILNLLAAAVAAGIAGLYSSWPIAIGIAVLLLLVVLKIARPLFQPALSLLLMRLYESEKGVLTQVALGLGAVAKLIQEVAKHL